MSTKAVLVISIALLGLSGKGHGLSDWGYIDDEEGKGPANWSRSHPSCGDHMFQSPINLHEDTAKFDPELTPLTFGNYDTLPDKEIWRIKNNGHTVVLEGKYNCTPHIQDGGLHGNYDVLQLHFHWGKDDHRGSEHHVAGLQYPLELHIVHKHRNNPPSKLQAPKDLAVVGVFFNIMENRSNEHLEPLIQALHQVQKPIEKETDAKDIVLKGFDLKSLLPLSPDYFRYNGSLTTPACNPIVLWTVFRQAVPVSRRQLEEFRKLWAHHHHEHPLNQTDIKYILDNARPTQPLGNRTVYLYTRDRKRMGLPEPVVVPKASSASRWDPVIFYVMVINVFALV